MIPSMDGMLNDFRRLTDNRLLATLHDEVKRERHITLRVLLLLIVVEQRKLHIDRYSSLFAYCTDRLKYSSSAAGRRIAGARCLRDYPRAWSMLFDGRLNLTTLCIIARVITLENADELLDRAAGGTQRQVEDLVAQYGGPKPVRDRIKPVRSLGRSPRPASPGPQEPVDSESSGGAASHAGSEEGTGSGAGVLWEGSAVGAGSRTRDGSGAGAPSETAAGSGSGAAGAVSTPGAGVSSGTAAGSAGASGTGSTPGAGVSSETAAGFMAGAQSSGDTSTESSAGANSSQLHYRGDSYTGSSRAQAVDEPLTYEIIFRADAAFVERLRRLQALLSTDPNPPLASILRRAIELALDRYDPERRQARRELRRTRKAATESNGRVVQDPTEVGFDSTETDSEKGGEQIEEKKSEKNGGKNSRKDGGKNSRKDGGKNGGKDGGKNSDRADENYHEENNGQSDDQTNEQKTSNPSRVTWPRRGGMSRRPQIPQWLRDQVLVRDKFRCTHVGPDGRCPAATALEIDHICPHAQGGSDDIDNLRTFCRAHNQRAAEIVFGVEFIRRCREEGRSPLETHPSVEHAVDRAEHEEIAQMEPTPI